MLKTNNFNLDLTAKDANGRDINILDSFGFAELYVHETINYIPYYELYLHSGNFQDLFGINDFILTYESTNEKIKYKVPLGVINKTLRGQRLLIKGWMTETKNFRVPQTRYLGKDIKEALQNLEIRDEINSKNNITGQIFQVNTTNLQQALSICQMGASTPYWSISRTGINLDPIEDDAECTVFNSPAGITDNSVVDTEAKVVDSPNSWYNAVWNKGSIVYNQNELKDLHQNLINNIKTFAVGPRFTVQKDILGEFNQIVGSVSENPNKKDFPDVKQWVLASVSYRYAMDFVSSSAQYYGVSDAIDQQKFVDGN